MSTYFLTGSRGFVGGHLLSKLQSMGHEVVTDMRYLHTRKYDCLIHLASKNNIKNEFDADLIESNIILTREIFKVNTRIIYASSCVCAFPLNPYAYSKLYAEHLGAIHGNAIGLRFQNIYGPGNNKGIVWWLMRQPSGATIKIRGAELVRDYIYVDSVVDAIINFLNPNPVFVNVDEINDEAKKYTPDQINSMVFESHHVLGNSFKLPPAKGVVDVGTGVGTSTLELVQLYRKLSGKHFELEFAPAGSNEPERMVSNNIVPHISLEDGLKKLING